MKTSRPWLQPVLVALIAIGVVAGFLHYRGPKQRLGPPGVKLSHDALLGGDNERLRTNGVVMPLRLTGFESIAGQVSSNELQFLPSDTTFGRRVYIDEADRFQAMVSLVTMGTDRSSIHRPEQCLGSQGFTITGRQSVQVPTTAGMLNVLRCNGMAPMSQVNGSRPTKAVFAYMFLSADHQTSSHIQRHLWTMRDMVLRGVMPRWTSIECYAFCRDGEEDATFEKMKRLLALLVPALHGSVPISAG